MNTLRERNFSVRVLLVDDHEMFLDGLQSLLSDCPGITLVGQARSGREAVKLTLERKPEVVIMDVSMPGLNGIEATRQIVAKLPDVRVICLSMHAEERFITAVLEAGASGYLLKDCAFEELVVAIDTVSAKKIYLSPTIAGTLVLSYRAKRTNVETSVSLRLTGREREVLQLIAEGHSTKEIGALLNVSGKTISSHREHIMSKLNIHSIAGLTKFAIREGYTSIDYDARR